MIYPATQKLKERLSEALQVPVYLAVPSKSKRPYLTLRVTEIHLGQGAFEGQVQIRVALTLWVDKKREAEIQRLLPLIQRLFPLTVQDAGTQMTFLLHPSCQVRSDHASVTGYELTLTGQERGG